MPKSLVPPSTPIPKIVDIITQTKIKEARTILTNTKIMATVEVTIPTQTKVTKIKEARTNTKDMPHNTLTNKTTRTKVIPTKEVNKSNTQITKGTTNKQLVELKVQERRERRRRTKEDKRTKPKEEMVKLLSKMLKLMNKEKKLLLPKPEELVNQRLILILFQDKLNLFQVNTLLEDVDMVVLVMEEHVEDILQELLPRLKQ